jgi:uncharacterized OB-fold protein
MVKIEVLFASLCAMVRFVRVMVLVKLTFFICNVCSTIRLPYKMFCSNLETVVLLTWYQGQLENLPQEVFAATLTHKIERLALE